MNKPTVIVGVYLSERSVNAHLATELKILENHRLILSPLECLLNTLKFIFIVTKVLLVTHILNIA